VAYSEEDNPVRVNPQIMWAMD